MWGKRAPKGVPELFCEHYFAILRPASTGHPDFFGTRGVSTAIHCCLDEWGSDQSTSKLFACEWCTFYH